MGNKVEQSGSLMKPETHTPPAFLTPAHNQPDRFGYSPKQLSDRWGVVPNTLRRWRKKGKLKACFIGGGVRFALSEIERFEREAQA